MQPYDEMLDLEKMCSIFLYNLNDLFFRCDYGCEKNKN